MTYKEFVSWCNDRACDGRWGFRNAKACCDIIIIVQAAPFWKRKKVWQAYEPDVVKKIVNPANELIAKADSNDDR